MVGTVEMAVITALKSVFVNYDVESFPTDFKNYQFTSPVGCFLVRFLNADFSEQNQIWDVAQEEILHFSITACYRGLSTYSEAYAPQQALKDTLQGLEICGRKIVLEKEEFLAEINTDLYFGLKLKITLWQEEKGEE